MKSTSVPEIPGAQDGEYAQLLWEFLFILVYKLERNIFWGFMRSPNKNMKSASDPEIPDAQDGMRILFGNLYTSWNKLEQNYFWDFSRLPNTNMLSASVSEIPGAHDGWYAHFFGIFYSSWYKLEEKLFLGFFEVAKHEYDIGFGPGNTWCPGWWVCTYSSGVFIHLGI